MEILPGEIQNMIRLFSSHPCADMIKEKREIYSHPKHDDTHWDTRLWAYWVLRFENKFGVIMVKDIFL